MNTNTVILHAYSGVREVDQIPTWKYLRRLSDLHPEIDIVDVECSGLNDYADAVRNLWNGPHTLINIEQDLEPDEGMIEELLECPEPLCSQMYWLAALSTGRTESLYCAFVGQVNNLRPVEHGEEYADLSGLGLIKLTAEARKAIGMPDQVRWNELDYNLATRIKAAGLRWHCHWPVCLHHHGFMRGENERVRNERRTAPR